MQNRLGLESAPEVRRLPILLAGADCTGDEDSLAACPGGTLGDVREAALGPCGFGSTSVALVCFNDAVSGADACLCSSKTAYGSCAHDVYHLSTRLCVRKGVR